MGAMGSRVSDRIAAISPSATLAVDAKAKALKAAGEPVIGFGAGEPDFPTPQHIVDAAIAACSVPANHKYTPSSGLPDLREAIAAKTMRDSGFACEAANVIVTNGGKQAVANSFAVLCDPGDEVIVPTPYWTTYPEAIALTGANHVPVITTVETGWKVTVEQLEAALLRGRHRAGVARSKPVEACRRADDGALEGRQRVGERLDGGAFAIERLLKLSGVRGIGAEPRQNGVDGHVHLALVFERHQRLAF